MSVFKTKYPKKTASDEGLMSVRGMPNPMRPFDDSVQPTTTPVEQSQLLASNYPKYDSLSVVNVRNRRK